MITTENIPDNFEQDIFIDDEFKKLIPPLSIEERSGLESSLINEGCRDAIVLWNGIIVDGHNRYDICKKNGIAFRTENKTFDNRDDAKVWIIKNQFSRRNLPAYERAKLALVLKPLLSAKAKENQSHGMTAPGKTLLQKGAKAFEEKIDTTEELASIAGVSHYTITKVQKIEEKAPEELKQKLANNEKDGATKLSIHSVYKEIVNQEKLEKRREELKQKTIAVKSLPETITLHHADFLKEYTKLASESVDCIITDPPYVREWLDNHEQFAIAAKHVLKPGGFLITYIGHIHMDKILEQMTPHLDYYWIMCLKHSGSIAAVHSRGVMCGMKPILVFQKPPKTMPKRYFHDLIEGTGREKDAHAWQQGEDEIKNIFESFTDPGDVVLDPFMGSGTTLSMAKKLHRIGIGFDIDSENVEVVRGRMAE